MGAGEEGGQRSVADRTARRSAWAATDVFSDNDDEDEGADGETRTRGTRTGRAMTAAPSQRGGAAQDRRGGKRGSAGDAARLPGGRGGNDPVDLLDAGTSGGGSTARPECGIHDSDS